MTKSATFLFHETLNDFLPVSKRNVRIIYEFDDTPAIKHAIEALGVPHPEIGLILVNQLPVDLFRPLQNNESAEIFPLQYRLDLNRLSEKFIADVHLGKLARLLRLFGFDTLYANHYSDQTIVAIAENEERIVLTRDRNLLKHKRITSGYWLRSQQAEEQLAEIIRQYGLSKDFRFFKRCVECNGEIVKVEKAAILERLLPKTILYYNDFFQCTNCKRIYWRGSHYLQMKQLIERIESVLR